MDRTNYFSGGWKFKSFYQKTRKLLKNSKKFQFTSASSLKKIRPFVEGALALALAYAAFEGSSKAALQSWLKNHLPSLKLVEISLMSQGWNPVKNEGNLHKIFRSMPTTFDEEGSFWWEPYAQILVYYEGIFENSMNVPRVFHREAAADPQRQNWTPLGMGWEGFQIALEKISVVSHPVQKPTFKRPPLPKDPREIAY